MVLRQDAVWPVRPASNASTGRKFFLDHPDDAGLGDLTFILNLHGGGSVGMWQRLYFPAHDFVDELGLVVATPSAATKQPAPGPVCDSPMSSTPNPGRCTTVASRVATSRAGVVSRGRARRTCGRTPVDATVA